MKEYIFNEKQYIEKMIHDGIVDENNPTYTIKNLARYNFYVCGMDKNKNYDEINKYMREHCDVYTEIGYQNIIKGCIRDVKKRPWANIDGIVITKQDLERIRALNDDRKERLAFVLLADAKFNDVCGNKKTDISWLGVRDLYQLARVTMPIKDRALFLSFLCDNGMIEENYNPRFTGMKLLYVSDDGEVGLTLDENSYKELAFTYMNWKNGGYKACEGCGRLIKIKGNTRYCKLCKPTYEILDSKIIKCVDCDMYVVVSAKDTKTCRCEECYVKHRRSNNLEAVRKYQAKH